MSRICPECGEEFNHKGLHHNQKCYGKFQSRTGMRHGKNNGKWIERVTKTCICGVEFQLVPSKAAERTFHSRECALIHTNHPKGKEHPCWRGGITFDGYPTSFNDELKEKIKTRDGFRCKICKMQGFLCVHHIDYDKMNSDENNLITLCFKCHGATCSNRTYWTHTLTGLVQIIDYMRSQTMNKRS